ncbi:MAG: single-stranded-DNA-specific exonuclease RecJ [Thermovirgaceae bacterium]
MSYPKARVLIDEITPADHHIAAALGCAPVTAAVLRMRGFASEEEFDKAREWLRPSLDISLDDLEFGTSGEKARGLWKGRLKPKRMVVYGDYDVDGVCSTVLAVELGLGEFGDVRYYIPHRHRQGYGVHEDVIDAVKKTGCDFLVAVDCGTRDVKALETAVASGLKVLVFDHHAPGPELPEGAVVVNPHVEGSEKGRDLCATAVLWAWAWKQGIADRKWLLSRLDLVALATVADSMILSQANRVLVREGLREIRSGRREGLDVLIRELDVNKRRIDEEDLAMKVIPCLNAAGRLGLAELAVKVLLGEGSTRRNVHGLISLNKKRQKISRALVDEISTSLQKGNFVLRGDNWPVGVLSSVASRLCNDFDKAVALAAPAGDSIRGTLRVPPGGNALEVLGSVEDKLGAWGGHERAAGFTVEDNLWEELCSSLEDQLGRIVSVREPLNVLACSPLDHTEGSLEEIGRLGPFGNGNPRPLFYAQKEEPVEFLPLGKDGRHYRIRSKAGDFLAFNAAGAEDELCGAVGWIYRPRVNYWRGRTKVDMLLENVVVP